jgi:hypothetical protein
VSRQTRAARRLRTYGQGRRSPRRCWVVASGETVVASGETEQQTNDNAQKAPLIELEQSAPRFSETLPTPCRVVRRGSPSRGTYVFRVLDAAGRRRSPATVPGYRHGIPRNKERRYAAEPPRVEEIIAIMQIAGDVIPRCPHPNLIVILWRAELRINDALTLAETTPTAPAGRSAGSSRSV